MPAMLIHPQFDPVAISLGPLSIHWYGLTYMVAFGLFLLLANRRLKHEPYQQEGWTARDVEDLLFWGMVGVIVGGRLGYCLFYKPGQYLSNPIDIFKIWQGGMAFHGGMLGVIVAMAYFARTRGKKWLQVTDFIAPCVPTGLASGRLGNFINGELWGRPANPDLPWAMVFPQAADNVARHPSQLYQFALEGMLLFALLWLFARKRRALGEVSAVFLLGYGLMRFAAEFFRQPDSFLGLLSFQMSMGQWLCVPMIATGAFMWWWARKAK